MSSACSFVLPEYLILPDYTYYVNWLVFITKYFCQDFFFFWNTFCVILILHNLWNPYPIGLLLSSKWANFFQQHILNQLIQCYFQIFSPAFAFLEKFDRIYALGKISDKSNMGKNSSPIGVILCQLTSPYLRKISWYSFYVELLLGGLSDEIYGMSSFFIMGRFC